MRGEESDGAWFLADETHAPPNRARWVVQENLSPLGVPAWVRDDFHLPFTVLNPSLLGLQDRLAAVFEEGIQVLTDERSVGRCADQMTVKDCLRAICSKDSPTQNGENNRRANEAICW